MSLTNRNSIFSKKEDSIEEKVTQKTKEKHNLERFGHWLKIQMESIKKDDARQGALHQLKTLTGKHINTQDWLKRFNSPKDHQAEQEKSIASLESALWNSPQEEREETLPVLLTELKSNIQSLQTELENQVQLLLEGIGPLVKGIKNLDPAICMRTALLHRISHFCGPENSILETSREKLLKKITQGIANIPNVELNPATYPNLSKTLQLDPKDSIASNGLTRPYLGYI